ncbi:MAG: hypothetical protein JW715_14925 [Sedimentisphaerales bacterium]|nr:hypothetical protein [Sedimentisphaerales bacterium]
MAKTLKTSADGRRCAFPKCNCLLSIYNHESYCHVHRDQAAQEGMRKTPYRHYG